MKKCPICGSTRLKGTPEKYRCERCGYKRGPHSMSFRTADTLRDTPD